MIWEEDEPEVDEQVAMATKTSNILIKDEEEEDEDDEALPLPSKANQQKESNRLLLANEEEDEYDEPLEQRQLSDILLVREEDGDAAPLSLAVREGTSALVKSSEEFLEAEAAIRSDPWDISSWLIYIEEVVQGRGGAATPSKAYEALLAQFPRSARAWKAYGEHLLLRQELDKAEEVLRRGSAQCFSVDLWLFFASFLRDRFVQAINQPAPVEDCLALRQKCEQGFEAGAEQVGLAVDALPLWRAYLDFVKDWPESDAIEATKKIALLRKIYQKVLCVAVDGTDVLWREYEAFEKERNEQGAEAVMLELNRKHLHSRSILKERKKLTANLTFDKFPTPPVHTSAEAQQLEGWSAWLSYELGGPDYLNADSFTAMVQMVFQQCLACFYYHAEVWLSFARFEQGAQRMSSARQLLFLAIEAIPQVSVLRVALAELEEGEGRQEQAKEVLRELFQVMPSGFSFSLYQRFLRRTMGVSAARRVFSETAPMRLESPKLSLELYVSHALLELEMNSSPSTALRVLDVALRQHPEGLSNLRLVRVYLRALALGGDELRLRHVAQTSLEAIAAELNEGEGADPARHNALLALLHPVPTSSYSFSRIGKASGLPEGTLRKLHLLLDLYLKAEVRLGCADLQHLERIREQRGRVKAVLDEIERREEGGRGAGRRGLFDTPCEIFERSDAILSHSLPAADWELKERCKGRSILSSSSTGAKGGIVGQKRDRQAMLSSDFHLSLSGLPSQLRDFVIRLPAQSSLSAGGAGASGEVESFLRHIKSVTLPPRPVPDEAVDDTQGGQDDWERQALESFEEGEDLGMGEGGYRYFEEREEDMYRQRQRLRAT